MKYKDLRVAGFNQEEAKEMAHYSPKTKSTDIERPLENTIKEELERVGLNDSVIAKNLKKLALDSTRPIIIKDQIYQTPDNLTRLKTLEHVSKLKGHTNESPNIAIDNRRVVINLDETRAKRIEEICSTLQDLNTKIAQGLEQSGEIAQTYPIKDIIDIDSNKQAAVDTSKTS